jgi:murein DD-endopeptidase MepM/ murein hydrolase activator NlpD
MNGFSFAQGAAAALVFLWSGALAAQVDYAVDGGAGDAAGGARMPVRDLDIVGPSRQDVRLGLVDADHDDSYLYRLPYGDDASFPIIQGYSAKLSHRGPEQFTLDFGMPIGTPVHAARDGVVVLLEDSHDIGCGDAECGRFANFVVVLHSDGTTGEYFHLARGSARVSIGQHVERGQVLALSGNTGFSTAPHLHFGVYRTAPDRGTESLSIRFLTRGGPVSAPRSGARYLNALE